MSGAAITSLRKAFQTSSQPTQAKALNAVMDNLTDAMVTLSSKNAIFVQSIINKHARNKVTKHATFEVSAEVSTKEGLRRSAALCSASCL